MWPLSVQNRKVANEFVNDLVDGTRPTDRFFIKKKWLNKREIVDNADLFVVNVVRVDPCWFTRMVVRSISKRTVRRHCCHRKFQSSRRNK